MALSKIEMEQAQVAEVNANLLLPDCLRLLIRGQLQQALRTATLELNLERSTRAVETVKKDEDIRKLRLQLVLLEDENEELNTQLIQEEEHTDTLQQDLDDALARSTRLEDEISNLTNELRIKTREVETMKVISKWPHLAGRCY